MTGHCCVGGPASSRFARGVGTAIASILTATLLVILPKCPLCFAAWLTFITGVGVSAAAALWVRGGLVMSCVVAIAVAAISAFRHDASGRALETLVAGFRSRRFKT
jgi:hypothetical protein